MENRITSRKNPYIAHLRALSSDGAYRRREREYVCDGLKLLKEAYASGGQILSVLWKEQRGEFPELSGANEYTAAAELFDYASPMKNSPGPVFTVRMPEKAETENINRAMVLENVQDPGNVGTVIRTANAFGIDAVILCGDCADAFSPKAVRASMGGIFRQRIINADLPALKALCSSLELPLYGAALSDKAEDIRVSNLKKAAVAVGSEGRGLSEELLSICDGQIIIPMEPCSESLNAAAAATVIMWEMAR